MAISIIMIKNLWASSAQSTYSSVLFFESTQFVQVFRLIPKGTLFNLKVFITVFNTILSKSDSGTGRVAEKFSQYAVVSS